MITVVKNIEVREYPIPSDTLALCERLGVLKHVPTSVPKDVTFELHETTTEMANALRRCMNSELEVLIMDFDSNYIHSDDSFIIPHELRKRINYIPIRQILGVTFSVDEYNPTNEIIPVYSRSIQESDSKKKNKEKMFSHTLILTYLRPGKRLRIKNIHIVAGTAYKKHAAFSFPGKVKYQMVNSTTEAKTWDSKLLPSSSMNTEPTKYRLSIPRQKYVDPVHIVKMAVKTLNNKLDKIYRIVKDNIEDFYSSEMEINYMKDKAIFKIFNETYTVGNLLSKYGYLVDNTITNIHCIKLHPSFNYVSVEIHHADPQKIILLSIERIKKELDMIGGAF